MDAGGGPPSNFMNTHRKVLSAVLVVGCVIGINGCADDYSPPPSMLGYWIGENATVSMQISISEKSYVGYPGGYLVGAGRLVMKETDDTLYITEASVYEGNGVSLGLKPDSLPFRSFYGSFKGANEVEGILSPEQLFVTVETSVPLTLKRQ